MNTIKRVVTVVGALLLLVYVGYQIFISAYSPVMVITAEMRDEYETIETQGLVLRNETLITSQDDGFVFYRVENGNRVAKNGSIADVYADEESAAKQQQIANLDAEIAELKTIQQQGQNNKTNLEIITKQLKKIQSEIIAEVASPNFTDIDTMSDELSALMSKQQITIGHATDFSERIVELTAQRNTLSKDNVKPIRTLYSPVSGYFVNTVDGYETQIDEDEVLAMTTEQVKAELERSVSSDETEYVGKVVGGYEWFLACVVPADKLTNISVDGTVKVRLPFASNETIPVTVAAQNRDRNGDIAVIFRCDYISQDFSNIRSEPVEILVKQHTGLAVPDEAVRFNDKQEAGVFIQEGNMIRFRRIQVLYHSDKDACSICAVNDDGAYLQLYDDIVLKGKRLYDGKIVR